MTSTFPKGRIVWRAYVHAARHLTSWEGVVALAVWLAVVAAVASLPPSPTFAERFALLLLAGPIALAVALCCVVAAHMWMYRRSDHVDRDWYADAMHQADFCVFFLRRRRESTGASFTEHGILECVVETPGGVTVTIRDVAPDMTGIGDHTVQARSNEIDCVPGRYEARWYGSGRKGRHFYEITRKTFIF